MEGLDAGDLKIQVAREAPNVLRLDWLGKSSSREPAVVLRPFFDEVIAKALEEQASVEMHFEMLEHFNSSTISAIIQLIQELREKSIRFTIVFNAGLKWQKLSFDALRIFEKADGLLTFRSVG